MFLACSGGGDRGIVLLGMIKELNAKKKLSYDKMAGISTGALVCALVSTLDNFDHSLDKKINMFMDDTFQCVDPWTSYFNVVDAYMFHESIYSSKPLKNAINNNFDIKDIKIPFTVGAYNKTLANYETLEPTSETILASASLPVVLPSVKINNYDYEDGGMRHLIPVREIKTFIKETEGPKHIDLLMCFPINNKEIFMKMLVPQNVNGLLKVAKRSLADAMLTVMDSDLNELCNIMNVSYDQMVQKPCNTFTNDKITLRILSPYYGWHSDFIHMTKENSKRLLESGRDTIKTYLSDK